MQSITANGPANAGSPTLCIFCHTQPPRYTCPRCHAKTCSASCSHSHKVAMACSGIRDRTGYVPMNSYGWGAMMDDYVFLEDVGRVVEVQGALMAKEGLNRAIHRSMSGGAGEGCHRRSRASGKSKREILQMQLGFKAIRVDLLPEGMQRQRSNMSRFDSRDNTICITCEVVLYAPSPSPTNEEAKNHPELFRFLVHHNTITTSLWDNISKHLARICDSPKSHKSTKSSQEKLPSWIQWYIHAFDKAPSGSMVSQERKAQEDDQLSQNSFKALLPEYPSRPLRRPQLNLGAFTPKPPSTPVAVKPYHLINPADPLQTSLRGKAFLEFPTFVLVPLSNEKANDAVILVEDVPEDGIILRDHKRRRLDDGVRVGAPGQPLKRMESVLGGYSSNEDDQKSDANDALGLLGGYDSDDSDPPAPDEDEDAEGSGDDGDAGDDAPSGRHTSPIASAIPLASRWLSKHAEEEEIDWGEDEVE